jgi:hypothetical protein
VLDLREVEAAGAEELRRAAVAVAAVGEGKPRTVQAVLPARKAISARADVLDEQEGSSRAEDASDLRDRAFRISDGAEDQGRDDRVEGVLRERQRLDRRADDLHSSAE